MVLVVTVVAFGAVMAAGFRVGMRAALGSQDRAHALFPSPSSGPGTPPPTPPAG